MDPRTTRRAALLALALAAAPAAAGAQQGLQHQVIAELQMDGAVRADSSVLNPGNAARLGGVEGTLRLFPWAEYRTGPVKARVDLRLEGSALGRDGTQAAAELQEGYVGVSLSQSLYLAAGRQRLGWGTGFIWNPTRIDAGKDPLRTSNRLRGIDAVRLEWSAGNTSVNVLAASQDVMRYASADDLLWAARAETKLGPVTTSLSAVNPGRPGWRLGWDWSAAGDRFTVYGEGALRGRSDARLVAGDGTGEARGTDGHVLGAHHDVVLGSMVNLTPRVMGLVEYEYRSDAWSGAEFHRFVDALPRNGELYDPIGPGRHRVFGMVKYSGADNTVGVALKAFADPVSRTLILAPTLERAGSRFKMELSPFVYVDRYRVAPFRASTQLVLSAYF
jgi:hypothetical protein